MSKHAQKLESPPIFSNKEPDGLLCCADVVVDGLLKSEQFLHANIKKDTSTKCSEK